MQKLKRIIKLIIVFAIALYLGTNNSMAVNYMEDMWELAINDLDAFLNMSVDETTDGSTNVIDSLTHTKAAYCIDPDDSHGNANHGNMRTYVVDVGKNGISSVNNWSTKNTGDSRNNYKAARAVMEIMYYATKSYVNNESSTFGADNTPYKMMLQGRLINNQSNMGGLFGNCFSGKYYDLNGKMYPGQPARLKREAMNYVNSTITYSFEDKSRKNVQAMYEVGNWILVGPYKIQNTGSGTIDSITAISNSGASYEADGWTTSISTSNIHQNKNLPNGKTFYLAFKTHKPDSIDKVKVVKTSSGFMRARMIFCQSNGGQNIGIWGGTFDSSTSEDELELPGVQFSNIKITKKDADSGKLLANVGFIVYNETTGKWVKDGTPAQYVNNKKDATVYISNSKGVVNIRNLSRSGKYTIYEVKQPHFGYEETSKDNPTKEIAVNIQAVGQTLTINMGNKRKYIKLSGFVWEDIISQKQSVRNSLYNQNENDDFDKLIANMTVSLRDAKGNLLKAEDGHEIQPRKTDSSGKYMFGNYLAKGFENEKILIDDIINGAYIEFEYNGMTYKSVPLYDQLGNLSSQDLNKASRATDEVNRDKSGENNPYFYSTRYATVTNEGATDTEGRVTNLEYDYADNKSTLKYSSDTSRYIYGYDGQTYPIDGIDDKYKTFANTKDANNGIMGKGLTKNDIYKNNMEEIPYINLGIMLREMPDLFIRNDVKETKITLNDYGHRYFYDQRESILHELEQENVDTFNVSVKFEEKYNPSYYREVYSSDIVYNQSDEGLGKLGVSIIYKVQIINSGTNVYTTLNELTNYYDSRLTLVSAGYDVDDNGDVVNSIAFEETNADNSNGYSKATIYSGQDSENLDPISTENSNSRIIYLQYELSNEAINAALNNDIILDNIVEVSSYSSFEGGFNEVYSGVDKDSRPDTLVTTSEEEITRTIEDDTEKAPTLTIRSPETRSIQGTVWEDSNIIPETATGYDKRREGNGLYETSENKVEGVKVDLINVDDNGNIASLYKEENGERIFKENATTTTNEQGNYELEGVIPGNYLLRYRYSDGTTQIVDTNGNKTPIEVENYKSTKYRGYNNENEDEANDDDFWYRKETNQFGTPRYSDAKDIRGKNEDGSTIDDIAEYRTTQRNYNYEETSNYKQIYSIEAETESFVIDIEHDVNADTISQYGADLRWIFDNIDFGIIRRPLQGLRIKKEISYIEVMLSDGQTLIKGDPRTENIENLRLIPQSDNLQVGQTVYLEIDNEIIQGATLRVEYEITVDLSDCEVDFNSKEYYYYNTIPNNYTTPGVWSMAIVIDLYDYVSNDLNYDENNNQGYNWEDITINQVPNGHLSPEALEAFSEYNKVLHTDYFSDMSPDENNRVKSQKLYLTRLLANNEMDFTFDNDVEVNEVTGKIPDGSTPGNYVPSNSPKEPDESEVEIIITGPTGGNQNYIIYGIIGLVIVIIFTTGIILIKRTLKK